MNKPLIAAPQSLTRGGALLVAALVGLVSGFAEAINGIVRHRVAHLPTGEVVAGELFWYAPLAAMLSMLVVSIALLALDMLPGVRGRVRLLVPGVAAGLGTYGLMRAMSVGIGSVASIILAVGVATVVTRIVAAYPRPLVRLARVAVPVVIIGLAVWAMALPRYRQRQERAALAALPAPAPGAPNVLVLIWDTVRAISTSLHGYERETTPELQRFAARGAVFDRAFATAPWSLPSHASLFTGRYPVEMTVGFRAPLDATFPTLAEVLSRRGYASAGITANLFYGSRDYGIARGFTWYDERPALNLRVVAHTWWLSRRAMVRFAQARGDYRHPLRRTAESVNESFLGWLDRRGDRPFLAVLNHFDAHEPYRPPDPFPTAFSDRPPRYWTTGDSLDKTDAVMRELRDAYDTSIRYLDHSLGELLRALEARGILDNTIVIVTSDHGELFGEHGLLVTGHAHSLYVQEVQVPLVVVYPPGVAAGVRRRETVSIRDVPATVMHLVAGDATPFPGQSLASIAGGPVDSLAARMQVGEKHRWANDNPQWPTSAGDMFAIVRGDMHYILNAGGREELYDLARDPQEQHDLATDTSRQAVLAGMRATLDTLAPARDGARSARVRR